MQQMGLQSFLNRILPQVGDNPLERVHRSHTVIERIINASLEDFVCDFPIG